MAGWLDDLLGKNVQANAITVPDRKRLNFVGAGVTVSDNPANLSTDVAISVVSAPGVDPLNPKSNGGTPAYPTSAAFVIAAGITFIRGGLADGDSIRFFGAGGGETAQVAYQFGRVTNLTAIVVDLYPLLTQHIFLNGVDQGAGVPVEIAPGSTILWAFDVSLNAHVSV